MAKKYDYKILPETTKARVLLALAFVGGLFVVAAYFTLFVLRPYGGWWDKIEVTYVNRTDTSIAVYINNDLDVTVPAGEETTVGYRKIEWWWHADLEARDLQGWLVFASRYDKDDLKRLHYRIVIDD